MDSRLNCKYFSYNITAVLDVDKSKCTEFEAACSVPDSPKALAEQVTIIEKKNCFSLR